MADSARADPNGSAFGATTAGPTATNDCFTKPRRVRSCSFMGTRLVEYGRIASETARVDYGMRLSSARAILLLVGIAVASASSVASAQRDVRAMSRPNVVLILMDDLGYG